MLGVVLSHIFIDPNVADNDHVIPQLFLMAVYGYILFVASNLISDGSEMLLSLYGPGIVGGLVIPILGAVPDGAIILLSGLGPKDEAQKQLNVGVGTLAGSTIMLLTIPWAAGVYLGRRDLDPNTGEAAFVESRGKHKPVLTHFSMSGNVVTTGNNVPTFSKIMMLTGLSYLIIQIPAFFDDSAHDAAKKEKPFALAGFIVTVLGFIAYSYYQLADAKHEDYLRDLEKQAIRSRWKRSLKDQLGSIDAFEKVFDEFDSDKNGHLDRVELTKALKMLGLDVDRQEVGQLFAEIDVNGDGVITRNEFGSVLAKWMSHHTETSLDRRASMQNMSGATDEHHTVDFADDHKETGHTVGTMALTKPGADSNSLEQPFLAGQQNDADDEEEEEEEAEEEYLELSDNELRMQAFGLLALGTLLVTVFSDPMVDVINAFGETSGIGAFYVSFVVTPIASNASEIISAMVFAKKKTNKGISLTLAALYGAAAMNNTFGLAIFMGLVYFRGLTWNFSAEVITILTVIVLVGVNGLKKTINLNQAAFVITLFPLSIGLVALLENAAGLQ